MISIIILLLQLYGLAIVARVILSWASVDSRNPAVEWLNRLTEPSLGPVRRFIQTERMGFDLSPLIVLLLLVLTQTLILRLFG